MAKILIERDTSAEEDRAFEINGTSPTKIAMWFIEALNARIDSEVVKAKSILIKDKLITEIETGLG